MSFAILLAASLLPGLAWVWYFYRQDRFEPEPRSRIVRVFVLGMVALFPAALAEAPFRPWISAPPGLASLLVVAVVVIGVVEESAKFLALYYGAYRSGELNEVMDGMIYGVTAGLGFAALENLYYTAQYGFQVAPARAVITCLAHASFTGLVGFYAGLAKMGYGSPRPLIFKGLVIAILFHGLYDFFILSRRSFFGIPGTLLSILLLVAAYGALVQRFRTSRRLSPFAPGRREGTPDGDNQL